MLGPVLTADYDFWIAIDDIVAFHEAAGSQGLVPDADAEAARCRGRYVLENDEHVDVLVAPSVPTIDGANVVFDEIWPRRRTTALSPDVEVSIPSLDDLIATKRFANRPRDAEDIRLLRILKDEAEP